MEHSLYGISTSSALETGVLHRYLEHSRRTKFIISMLNSLWLPQRLQLFPLPLKSFFLWVWPVWKFKALLQVSPKALPQNSVQLSHLIAWTKGPILMKRTRSIASSEAKSTKKPSPPALLSIIHFKNKHKPTAAAKPPKKPQTTPYTTELLSCTHSVAQHSPWGDANSIAGSILP